MDAKRSSFSLWRKKSHHYKYLLEIQKRFLSKLLMSKAGRVAEAFRIIKKLPTIDGDKQRKALKFEKNLSRILDKNLLRSFNSFKKEF